MKSESAMPTRKGNALILSDQSTFAALVCLSQEMSDNEGVLCLAFHLAQAHVKGLANLRMGHGQPLASGVVNAGEGGALGEQT